MNAAAVAAPVIVCTTTSINNSPEVTRNVAELPLARPLPLTVKVPGVPVTVAEPLLAMSL